MCCRCLADVAIMFIGDVVAGRVRDSAQKHEQNIWGIPFIHLAPNWSIILLLEQNARAHTPKMLPHPPTRPTPAETSGSCSEATTASADVKWMCRLSVLADETFFLETIQVIWMGLPEKWKILRIMLRIQFFSAVEARQNIATCIRIFSFKHHKFRAIRVFLTDSPWFDCFHAFRMRYCASDCDFSSVEQSIIYEGMFRVLWLRSQPTIHLVYARHRHFSASLYANSSNFSSHLADGPSF